MEYQLNKQLTKEEIEEGDEIFLNFFLNLIENNDIIIINWKKNKEIKYTIKNLLKISILDINYNIQNLIIDRSPYIEFIWNMNSTFKILIFIDKDNKNNIDYIKKYKLIYGLDKSENIINIINDKNNIEWFNIINENKKNTLYLDKLNIYKIILCYYLTILKPLFIPSYCYSSSILDISNNILYNKNMDELEIISNNFSYNISYNLINSLFFELEQSNNPEEFIIILNRHIKEKYTYDYYNINIKFKNIKFNEEKIKNYKLKINIIHDINSYNSLLWFIKEIFSNISII